MAEVKKLDWISLLVGFFLVIGGVFSFSHPLATFSTLAIMLGIVVLVRGIVLIVAFFKVENRTGAKVFFALVLGIFLVITGIIFLFRPLFAANVFAFIIAIWFIVDAINNLINADRIKPAGKGIYFLSIVFNVFVLIGGVILVLHPLIAGLSVAVLIGITLLVFGVNHIVLAFIGKDSE
ncbi:MULTISPECIES: HdeD family acid-resistance protein [unclassified Mesotoga]|uniref:HdeD family acid-resistance protein n=1 Tax=unclassified Mesotoga TaxID=1184398 RepID=UPI000DA66B60|nr:MULTISPECIES: DUF308 domain-containing protein [unclassified Mesotoga]PZC51663.1 hypothetical protein LH53_09700 [Mesotoga sp. TolDC]